MCRYLFFVLLSSRLFSLPQGGILINGEADLHLSPKSLEILASDRSIIEWSDFSIETGETVRFIQPNSTASVLNRVMEAYPSRLMGNLEANGQVLLINPNGVLVGQDAQINTTSFIASTLDLLGQGFSEEGVVTFKGTSSASLISHRISELRCAITSTWIPASRTTLALAGKTLSLAPLMEISQYWRAIISISHRLRRKA